MSQPTVMQTRKLHNKLLFLEQKHFHFRAVAQKAFHDVPENVTFVSNRRQLSGVRPLYALIP